MTLITYVIIIAKVKGKQIMNALLKWFAKKYVVSIVNDILDAAKSKVDI